MGLISYLAYLYGRMHFFEDDSYSSQVLVNPFTPEHSDFMMNDFNFMASFEIGLFSSFKDLKDKNIDIFEDVIGENL